MKKVVFNFEKLTMYQKSLDFIDAMYTLTTNSPSSESYGLTSRYQRAALSITLNISEVHGDTEKQFNRCLTMAWNSVKECVNCSTIARRRNFISQIQDDEARLKLEELAKMITGLPKSLKR